MIGCFNIKTQGSETFVLLTKKRPTKKTLTKTTKNNNTIRNQ